MLQMYEEIEILIKNKNIDYVVLEGIQFQKNYKTFQQLSQLQGVIIALLFNLNKGYQIEKPSEWKKVCGIKVSKRVEQKKNTMEFVKITYGLDVGEDESDAIGIGYWSCSNLTKVSGD